MTHALEFEILFKKVVKEWKKNKIFRKVIDCRDKNIKFKLCIILEKNIRDWLGHSLEIIMRDLHDEMYGLIIETLEKDCKFNFTKSNLQSIKKKFEQRLKEHTLFVDNPDVNTEISQEYLWTLEDKALINTYFEINKI